MRSPVVRALAIVLLAACGGSDASTPAGPSQTPVAAVSVTGSSNAMVVGTTLQLTATAVDANGATLTDRTITWTSSDTTVATVSSSGLVSALASGSATIQATAESKSGSLGVTVTATANLATVAGDAQAGLTARPLADSLTVKVTTPTGAPAAGTTVTWSATSGTLSSPTAVADAAGVARVQWTAPAGAGSATASVSGATSAVFHATGHASPACSLVPSDEAKSFGMGPTDTTLSLVATRPHKVIALFVDFSDAPATQTTQRFVDSVITPGVALLNEFSYGRASFTVTPVNKWYRMSKPASAYGFQSLTFDLQKAYMQEAMSLADADVDFSQYDVVYVVAAPTSSIPVSPTFNAFIGTGLTFDGHEIHNGITFGQDSWSANAYADASYGATVLAHESGHMMGLVDLYSLYGQDVSTQATYQSTIQKYVGPWSIMGWNARSAHYLAWEKLKLGFLDPAQVDCLDQSGGVEEVVKPIETVGGLKAVAVKIDASRAIVVELRTLTGADSRLCSSGVLVYEVDAQIATGKGVIVVKPSRQSTDQSKINNCGTYWDAPFDASGGANSNYVDPSGITISVIRAEADGSYRIRVKRP